MHGSALLYLLGLVFIFVQSEDNARLTLKFFYPELGRQPSANDLLYASGTPTPKLGDGKGGQDSLLLPKSGENLLTLTILLFSLLCPFVVVCADITVMIMKSRLSRLHP